MNKTSRILNEPKLLTDRSACAFVTGHSDLSEISREPASLFIDEIHARAETITPLLKEILNFRPRPLWETN